MKQKIVLLRNSERQSYKACRQMWHWAYNDRLVPRGMQAPALEFGTLVHGALEHYYRPGRKRGPHPAKTFVTLFDERTEAGFSIRIEDGDEGDEAFQKWVSARDLGVDMLEGYIKQYGEDDHMKILWSEMPFEIDINDDKGNYLVTVVGRFDQVYYDLNLRQVGLLETKTAASIDTNYIALDEQAGTYWAFASLYLQKLEVLKPGKDISFIQYNWLRKATEDTRPEDENGHKLNKNGEVSKRQPSPRFVRKKTFRTDADRENLLARVRMEAREMAFVRAGKLDIIKNPRHSWPDQHCKGCRFRIMCELHETGGDWEEFRDAMFDVGDPYSDHRESEEDPVFDSE